MREQVRAVVLLVSALLAGQAVAGDTWPLAVEWDKASDTNLSTSIMRFSSAFRREEGPSILQVSAAAVPESKYSRETSAAALVALPVGPIRLESDGLSFEIRGDGSKHYASVFVGESASLFNAYEAVFPLQDTEWQTMTVRWRDFVKNDLPWDPQARLPLDEMSPAPGKLTHIGFGRGQCHYRFFTPQFGFEIRNLRIVSGLAGDPVPAFSPGLSRTRTLLSRGVPLNVLLLGDSITDLGSDKSYGYHCARLIQTKWGVTSRVVNAGIAGHTARSGTIVLPRSLRALPEPDLVCILYGANDCKAMDRKSGFDEAVFARNLEDLIDQVRRRTGGRADIVLLTGVPRLGKAMKTSGAVEQIVSAVGKVAREKQAACCDTFSAYLALSEAEKKTYYQDTIHQTTAGQVFIGRHLFETIETATQNPAP